MYFSKKNNFFHGIMFHHFHDDVLHKRGQGSISQDDFYNLSVEAFNLTPINDAPSFDPPLSDKTTNSSTNFIYETLCIDIDNDPLEYSINVTEQNNDVTATLNLIINKLIF